MQKQKRVFHPTSIVKLIVEFIEPFHGRIYDPACGSGGMFVQSAAFVEQHRKAVTNISIHGQEKVDETIRLCKMNLAVHGLSGDIRQGVTYYEDIHKSVGKFDIVMANPPFNVDKVDKERLKTIHAIPLGSPGTTTSTIYGYKPSTLRLRHGPGSSWRTLQVMREALNLKFAGKARGSGRGR